MDTNTSAVPIGAVQLSALWPVIVTIQDRTAAVGVSGGRPPSWFSAREGVV